MKKIKKENLALKKEVISFLSDEKLKAIKGMGGDTNTNTLGLGCPTATFYGVCLSKGCKDTNDCGSTFLSQGVCEEIKETRGYECLVSAGCRYTDGCVSDGCVDSDHCAIVASDNCTFEDCNQSVKICQVTNSVFCG